MVKMVPVTFSGTIMDEASGVARASFAVPDEYSTVQLFGSVDIAADGSYTVTAPLVFRWHIDDTPGRHYTVTVTAWDRKGNVASVSAGLLVPRGHVKWKTARRAVRQY